MCAIPLVAALHHVKAVILAGGLGSRLSEETTVRPKPMVEIGGKPMLWHIMKIYATHGIEEFVICLGYKGYLIKEYFANYYLHTCDVSFDLATGGMEVHRSATEPWRVTVVDTGEHTMTGGRLQRALPFLGDEDFCFTYGDGLADIDISALVAFHREQQTLATVTAVQPPGRFGALDMDGDRYAYGESWNGSTWTARYGVEGPEGDSRIQLNGVSCTSATSCTAVGELIETSGHVVTVAEYWNGTKWTRQTTINAAETNNRLTGVSCTSSTFCFATAYELYEGIIATPMVRAGMEARGPLATGSKVLKVIPGSS